MKKLETPKINPIELFSDCVDGIQNEELRENFSNSLDFFKIHYKEYKKKAINKELHTLEVDYNPTKIKKSEWINIYTNQLSKRTSKGRKHYDNIKMNAPNNMCPLCSYGQASQIDHVLPKTHYPLLSVALINLVPICADCNKAKGNKISSKENDQPLHPYFDDIDSDQWLKADVIEDYPMGFVYSVDFPHNWTSTLSDRVKIHFKTLGLGQKFAAAASNEISGRELVLKNLFTNGGATILKNHLQETYLSFEKVSKNSWQAALYRALWRNDWFCNGSFISKCEPTKSKTKNSIKNP